MRTYRQPSTCRSSPALSSVIARRVSMNMWAVRVASLDFRSTPRIASTAKPATSRTRPRTSTGSLLKAAEAPITRICKWLGGVAVTAVALAPMPAAARLAVSDPARTYVQARAAAMNGDHARAAQLLANLAGSQPDKLEITKKEMTEAIGAGQMDLALSLARTIPAAKLSTEARLLLVTDEVKRRRADRAVLWLSVAGDNGDLTFLRPLIASWDAADRGNLNQALATLDQVPANSLLAPLRAEQRAAILLKFRRTADAEPFARRAIGAAGPREDRLRLAFADGFLAAGDRARAAMMLEGMGADGAAARQRVLAGKS